MIILINDDTNNTNTNTHIIIDMRPDATDMEGNTYYCTALASGIVYLHKKNPTLCYSLLESTVTVLIDGCNAEFTQIHCAVATALKRIINQCFDEELTRSAIEASNKKLHSNALIR